MYYAGMEVRMRHATQLWNFYGSVEQRRIRFQQAIRKESYIGKLLNRITGDRGSSDGEGRENAGARPVVIFGSGFKTMPARKGGTREKKSGGATPTAYLRKRLAKVARTVLVNEDTFWMWKSMNVAKFRRETTLNVDQLGDVMRKTRVSEATVNVKHKKRSNSRAEADLDVDVRFDLENIDAGAVTGGEYYT